MSSLLSRCLILVLGTLYPAYRSYKAIKNKDLREHVKWMMYWIVFALFTTLETFLDIFLSWFPFYYEIKIVFILWVLSPATRGSSILYKKVVHPMLNSREQEIDELIEKTKVQGYSTFLQLFTSGFNYISNLFMNSALRGQVLLGAQLQKNFSLDAQDSQKVAKPNDMRYNQRDLIDDDYSDFDTELEGEQRRTIRNTKKGSSKSSYEIVDDTDLLDDQIDIHKKITNKTTAKKRAPKQNEKSNYRSNEASHYGTITRGKTTKNRSQLSNSNESDQ